MQFPPATSFTELTVRLCIVALVADADDPVVPTDVDPLCGREVLPAGASAECASVVDARSLGRAGSVEAADDDVELPGALRSGADALAVAVEAGRSVDAVAPGLVVLVALAVLLTLPAALGATVPITSTRCPTYFVKS